MATKTTVKGKTSGPKARIVELQRRIDAANTANKKRYSLLSNSAVALNVTERKTMKAQIEAANENNAKRRTRIAKLKKVVAGK